MPNKYILYFDAEDYALLEVVNRFLAADTTIKDETEQGLFHTSLHPHGIKELAVSQEIRVAYSVFNLLNSLQAGQVQDRINALQSLHDEVLSSATSTFRYNTGRVLIQIMKGLVRAYGNFDAQLRLAHDFRKAASGKRRIIRAMMHHYNLLEMPEAWNQLTFDNHVHDANTKGRKSPTHLIMDAWIKGIRQLDVVYYNYIETSAAQELLQAAAIVNIKVRIGVEFQARFRDRYVQFVWQPCGFHAADDMLAFLNEKPTQHLITRGKEASKYHHSYVMRLVERYNSQLRHEMGKKYHTNLETLTEQDILTAVGIGQTSRTHLAELILSRLQDALEEQLYNIENIAKKPEERAKQIELFQEVLDAVHSLVPDEIIEDWLSQEKNPDIIVPLATSEQHAVPEIMRILPMTLIDWLTSLRPQSYIILNLNKLTAADALELLYECAGSITHLELFNFKNYKNGTMPHIQAISQLQIAINEGSTIALKKHINNIIKNFENTEKDAKRITLFQTILRNIPQLQSFYAVTPLNSRIGSDSTSRTFHNQGMGFALIDTLPERSKKELKNGKRNIIPVSLETYSRTTYYPKRYSLMSATLLRFIRKLPWLRQYNTRKQEDWFADQRSCRFNEKGNITTLGGFTRAVPQKLITEENHTHRRQYINTTWLNIFKVAFGFSVTAATFAYTQTWWALAWFGPIIWFTITGFRNIFQSILSAGGIRRSPLLHLNDCISWARISDSLMFTGFSVPLLELGVRTLLLNNFLHINSMNNPMLFFTIMSLVNGAYIASHNIFRGLPAEAIIGNSIRSVLAIPVSIFYSFTLTKIFYLSGLSTPENMLLLQQGAAVISKLASDSVATVIEGLADRASYLRNRYWGYRAKLQELFNDYAELELLFPEENAIDLLQRPKAFLPADEGRLQKTEEKLIITCLDLMYFWMYQPHARATFMTFLHAMPQEEREIFIHTQNILTRVQGISQLFVNGLVGFDFARPLAFYLEKHKEYLRDMAEVFTKNVQCNTHNLPPSLMQGNATTI